MKTIYILPFFLVLFVSCETETEIEKFDRETAQTPVLTRTGIDSLLDSFEQIEYADLDTAYLSYSESNKDFKHSLKKQTYFQIKGTDVLLFIVGEFRIKSFVTRDKYYDENNADYSANKTQYWLVDKNMLYMLLDLILTLDEKGYN